MPCLIEWLIVLWKGIDLNCELYCSSFWEQHASQSGSSKMTVTNGCDALMPWWPCLACQHSACQNKTLVHYMHYSMPIHIAA